MISKKHLSMIFGVSRLHEYYPVGKRYGIFRNLPLPNTIPVSVECTLSALLATRWVKHNQPISMVDRSIHLSIYPSIYLSNYMIYIYVEPFRSIVYIVDGNHKSYFLSLWGHQLVNKVISVVDGRYIIYVFNLYYSWG